MSLTVPLSHLCQLVFSPELVAPEEVRGGVDGLSGTSSTVKAFAKD